MSNSTLFDSVLLDLFRTLDSNSRGRIIKRIFLYRLLHRQKKAFKKRESWRSKGVPVPPILISSITHQCNLKCDGCYASIPDNMTREELSPNQWASVYRQAVKLGMSIIMIAGGEPLMKPELLYVLKKFKKALFIIFTNGMLLTPEIQSKIKKANNILPVLSLDGKRGNHDNRRGEGTFDQIIGQINNLKNDNLRFGVSITVTKENFSQVTDSQYIESLIQSGIQIFFFIEFVPKHDKSQSLVISSDQQSTLENKMKKFQNEFHKPFITFPGNEKQYGGCLAAGRGFVHIGTDGNIEPCPFAPFSDKNIIQTSLKDALQSSFLKKIRENHDKLTETQGGCSLWSHREWVQSLLTPETE